MTQVVDVLSYLRSRKHSNVLVVAPIDWRPKIDVFWNQDLLLKTIYLTNKNLNSLSVWKISTVKYRVVLAFHKPMFSKVKCCWAKKIKKVCILCFTLYFVFVIRNLTHELDFPFYLWIYKSFYNKNRTQILKIHEINGI